MIRNTRPFGAVLAVFCCLCAWVCAVGATPIPAAPAAPSSPVAPSSPAAPPSPAPRPAPMPVPAPDAAPAREASAPGTLSPGPGRAWIGVVLQELESGTARVLVVDLVAGGPAQIAGIRQGDRILKIGGEDTPTIAQVAARLERTAPGESLGVIVRRGRDDVSLLLSPRLRPDESDPAGELAAYGEALPEAGELSGGLPVTILAGVDDDDDDECEACETEEWSGVAAPSRAWLGVSLLEMTPELRVHFGAPADEGVLVGQVRAEGPAARSGLRVGDVLVSVDDDPVHGPGEVSESLAGREPGETVRAAIVRDGHRMAMPIELGRRPEPASGELAASAPFLRRLERLQPQHFWIEADDGSAGSRIEDLGRRIEELRSRLDALARRLEAAPGP